ncbi:MAG TPA: enoyl-CoA hydratase [Caulobacteraceae bacterium]|jgi:enoyl-CoA hydratase/carnithine racemase|nr:enoyl-CoA hydratase [Caulobacteraceae bacterium]
MTDEPAVHVRREAGEVAVVTLDRAAKLNVLNSTLMARFVEAMEVLAEDDDLRAVVITGAGERAFVGGADVDEMATLRTPDEGRAFITRVHRCCAAVRDMPVPVIGRVNGYALGAGLELAAACDLRIAADTARFGMPEVKLGIPSVVEAALLPSLVGWGRAREMLLLGETFGAEEALRWGLVEAVVPPADLDAAVEARLTAILSASPKAVRLQKALIRRWEDLPMKEAIAAGIEAFASAFETDEPERALADFVEAREARRVAKRGG